MTIPFAYVLILVVMGLVLSLVIGAVGWLLGLLGGWLLHDRFG